VPLGTAHLPKERIGAKSSLDSTALGAVPFVQEALRWLPDAGAPDAGSPDADFDLVEQRRGEAATGRRRIVWADDNADMRDYVRRLLSPRYEIEAVSDGAKALDAIRARRPDLVLADVMMPELDGLGLARALRADPQTASLPVILISARAGEEPRIEGLGAGADEYLYKPFSARELLARIESRLEKALLYRQREQLIEKLREADRRKDEFLATLSHELRNPLAPLRNALHLLLVSGSTGARSDRLREIIERQVNHLVRLVDDLLEMSRINQGTLEMRNEHVELAAIVKSAVETSEPLIARARHELCVSLPNEPTWLEGDPVRLAQLLSNLLNNAAQYTEPGGRIALEARVEGGGLEIAVRDNGAGIAPEGLDRIFEMFSRGERASRRNQGGLGIGLSLSRRLAEMHGGSLSAKSEGVGKGSEFLLTLPLSRGELRKSEASRDAEAQRLLGRRILVVDDNQDSLESLGALLGFLGADVRTAADGPAALAVFADYDPSMVFLDIGMPGMDGYEVARRIRDGFPERRAVLVALTGWGQSDDRRRAREAGFDHHLIKPADLTALQQLLSANGAASP
jgi:signal transduction histidine kinase